MCQAFTCQGSGKFISFPELAAPDTTIKAQELMISPVKTPASQAAGLGSIPDQHLQPVIHPALQGEGQNASGGTWSTRSVLHLRFIYLLPVGPLYLVSSEGLYLVTASRL